MKDYGTNCKCLKIFLILIITEDCGFCEGCGYGVHDWNVVITLPALSSSFCENEIY